MSKRNKADPSTTATLSLRASELEALDALARREGLSRSDLVRVKLLGNKPTRRK